MKGSEPITREIAHKEFKSNNQEVGKQSDLTLTGLFF